MTTTVIVSPVQSNGADSAEYTQINVQVDAKVISVTRARRRVNGWLCLDVGDRMLAREPELVIGDPLLWRVPVDWTSPTQGVLATRICDVFVEAVTGDIRDAEDKILEINRNVEREIS